MYFHARPDLGAVELKPQTHEPVVAIDRRWCFDTPTTLHIEENPLTRKLRVRNLESKTPLLEIQRITSKFGDLFHVFDAVSHKQILTVDGFGFHGRFDVYRGHREQSVKRATGPLLMDVTCAHSTIYFDDADARRPTRAVTKGKWADRVAVVSIHHAISSQAVARIHRRQHLWLRPPHYLIEIAPGVDMFLPLLLWLGRWVQCERELLVHARTSGWGVECF